MTRLFSTPLFFLCLPLCVLCASVFQSLRLFHSLRLFLSLILSPDLGTQKDLLLAALDFDTEIITRFIRLESLVHLLAVRDFAVTDFEDTVIGFDAGFLGPSAWHDPLDNHTFLPLLNPHP
jgi:hypothetical protein